MALTTGNNKQQWLRVHALHLVLAVLLLATVCFIWSRSFATQEESSEESAAFTEEVVKPVVKAVTGTDENVEESVVRKFAHAFEHAVLGFELLLFFGELRRWRWWQVLLRSLSFGWAVAFLDESIQILSKRGPAIADVWIDVSGLAAGILLAGLVWLCNHSIKVARKKQIKSN